MLLVPIFNTDFKFLPDKKELYFELIYFIEETILFHNTYLLS